MTQHNTLLSQFEDDLKRVRASFTLLERRRRQATKTWRPRPADHKARYKLFASSLTHEEWTGCRDLESIPLAQLRLICSYMEGTYLAAIFGTDEAAVYNRLARLEAEAEIRAATETDEMHLNAAAMA